MQSEAITVYESHQRQKVGLFASWKIMLSNIFESKELIRQVFLRDFLAVYKKSFLGVGWLFLSPLIGIASWVFMNAMGVLKPGDVGVPYPAYVLLGSTLWGLFIGFYTASSKTLETGVSFILQVKYPHEVLLLQQIATYLAQFLISLALNLIVLACFGIIPSWKIIFFPVAILPLCFLGVGIGMMMTVIKVVIVDFQKGFDHILAFAIFLTPIIYSSDPPFEALKTVIRWNPLTYLVGGVRDLIFFGQIHDLGLFLICSAATFVFFLMSWRFFFLTENKVVERMI